MNENQPTPDPQADITPDPDGVDNLPELSSDSDAPPALEPDPADESATLHADFVRRMNGSFAAIYSLGGLAILGALALLISLSVVFFGIGTLASPYLWVSAVLVFLVGLFVLRVFVARRALRLLGEIRQYCAQYQLGVQGFRRRFTHNETYPFFDSIFEVTERRGISIDADSIPSSPEQRTDPQIPDSDENHPI